MNILNVRGSSSCIYLLFFIKENMLVLHCNVRSLENLKGIVHLNIIFSYMKFNKICSLDYHIF